MNETLTLSDLQQGLDAHKQEALQLRDEIQDLRTKLSSTEERLDALLGGFLGVTKSKPGAVSQNKPQASALETRRRLREFIVEVLRNSNESLTVKEISELVKEAGYQSNGKPEYFATMVLGCLSSNDEFRRTTRSKTKPIRFALATI